MAEKITVPTLGESVTEATVSKWLKSQGDEVVADEPLVELETDKVNVEVPAPGNGILSNIAVKEGETVSVGTLLGTINGARTTKPEVKEIKNYNPPKQEKEKKISPPKSKKQEILQLNEEEPLILDQVHEEELVKKNISKKTIETRVSPSARKIASIRKENKAWARRKN
jgi:2-oxoglutarate dehydrogenase E2 component (dihydrolipoamide succinyltransferase)